MFIQKRLTSLLFFSLLFAAGCSLTPSNCYGFPSISFARKNTSFQMNRALHKMGGAVALTTLLAGLVFWYNRSHALSHMTSLGDALSRGVFLSWRNCVLVCIEIVAFLLFFLAIRPLGLLPGKTLYIMGLYVLVFGYFLGVFSFYTYVYVHLSAYDEIGARLTKSLDDAVSEHTWDNTFYLALLSIFPMCYVATYTLYLLGLEHLEESFLTLTLFVLSFTASVLAVFMLYKLIYFIYQGVVAGAQINGTTFNQEMQLLKNLFFLLDLEKKLLILIFLVTLAFFVAHQRLIIQTGRKAEKDQVDSSLEWLVVFHFYDEITRLTLDILEFVRDLSRNEQNKRRLKKEKQKLRERFNFK